MKNLLERQPLNAVVCALAALEPDSSNGAVEMEIRRFLARNFLFSEGEPSFNNEASFVQEGIIDSLGVVELVTFARSQFGVEVSPADVTPANFDSVTRMAAYIRRKRPQNHSTGQTNRAPCAGMDGNSPGESLLTAHRELASAVCSAKAEARKPIGGSLGCDSTMDGRSAPALVPGPDDSEHTPRSRPEETSSIVEIQPSGNKTPLFLVHGVGGGMFWGYSNLARHLGTAQPVYAFKSMQNASCGKNSSIEEMAAQYVKDLLEFRPLGPYLLGGYCFGGNVAYEMARQLRMMEKEVGLVLLMNCWPNNSSYTLLDWTPGFLAKALWNFCIRMTHQIRSGSKRPREYFKWRATWARKRLTALFSGNPSAQLIADDFVDLSALAEKERNVWRMHVQAWLEYKPRPYPGHIVLFRTRGHPLLCSFDHEMGWGSFAAQGVTVKICPGDHESILEEENVEATARELECVLAKTEELSRITLARSTGKAEVHEAALGAAVA